jgi:cytochrome c oxidase assembly protein Cox11
MKAFTFILSALLSLLAPGLKSHVAEALPNLREPNFVIQGYLRAMHAGDYIDAYRYIFAAEQRSVRIPIRLSVSNVADLDVTLSKNEVVVQPGDFFEVSLRIKNRSKQRVNARIDHVIEPREVANYLDLVECGFLVPVTLQPEIEQEYSARYLLRESIPEGVHRLSLTYDFKLRKVIGSR